MDLDFWWLLVIPVVFALGWMASRYDLKTLLSENANLPRSYFRGLNFLLNEQPDKAIDAFIEVAKLDPETVEMHFALGNLFRRRGETERAIRVHQNLLAAPDLPVAERDHALYELGQDFLKAGLLDRAEETFTLARSGRVLAGRAARAADHLRDREGLAASRSRRPRRSGEMGAGRCTRKSRSSIASWRRKRLQPRIRTARAAELEIALQANPDNVRATMLAATSKLPRAMSKRRSRTGGASRNRTKRICRWSPRS